MMNAAQLDFINEYLQTWNATEAYARAYPRATRETARRNGHRLLTNADIRQELKRRISERALSADEALIRLAEQARNVGASYIRADGSINLAGMIADGRAHLIHRVRRGRYGLEYEFHDAQAALIHIDKRYRSLPADDPADEPANDWWAAIEETTT